MIEEEYVFYETAKLLKEKGFNIPTFAYFEGKDFHEFTLPHPIFANFNDASLKVYNYIAAPTQAVVMRWLREIHYCHINIYFTYKADANLDRNYATYCYVIEYAKTQKEYTGNIWYNTYEDACESAIYYCLENVLC